MLFLSPENDKKISPLNIGVKGIAKSIGVQSSLPLPFSFPFLHFKKKTGEGGSMDEKPEKNTKKISLFGPLKFKTK